MNRSHVTDTALDRNDLNLSEVSVYMLPGRSLQARAIRTMLRTAWQTIGARWNSRSRPRQPLDDPYCTA